MSRAKHLRDAVMEYVDNVNRINADAVLQDYRQALREEFYTDALDAIGEIEMRVEDSLTPESRLLLSWIKTALDTLAD